MQSVIGEYFLETEAERAVRQLEQHALSIQDIVIVDRRQKIWRTLKPSRGRKFPDTTQFVVLMRGQPADIERARSLMI